MREVIMKAVHFAFLPVAAVLFAIGISFAAQEASVEKGRALFNDPKLGTTGKSCNTCHPIGKGLEKSGLRQDLTDVVNGCITIPLKGKALNPDSVEMKSIVQYIKSLGSK